MQLRVLGSAAGGGYPQWNCNCDQCVGVRTNSIKTKARTQSSIAISENGEDWILINASPDIRQQIIDNPELQPNRSRRDTGIAAIILMDSQIDHTTGLLMLRENKTPLQIYTTEMVRQDMVTGFPIFSMLEYYCGVDHHQISIEGKPFQISGFENYDFHPIPLMSKAPPYSPHRHNPHLGDNIGLLIHDLHNNVKTFYAPGLGVVEDHLLPIIEESDLLLVDGTTWQNDEMAQQGVGDKLSSEMGHLSQSGAGGMLEQLERFKDKRRVLIHINNTNPILNENGPERALLDKAGIEVAYDGMHFNFNELNH